MQAVSCVMTQSSRVEFRLSHSTGYLMSFFTGNMAPTAGLQRSLSSRRLKIGRVSISQKKGSCLRKVARASVCRVPSDPRLGEKESPALMLLKTLI